MARPSKTALGKEFKRFSWVRAQPSSLPMFNQERPKSKRGEAKMKMSRRSFLGAAYGAAATSNFRLHVEVGSPGTRPGEKSGPGFLTAALYWEYPTKPGKSQYGEMLLPYAGVILRVSLQENLQNPFIDLRLPEDKTSFRLSVAPDTIYYWAVIPFDEHGEHPEASSSQQFRTGKPQIENVDDDRIRYMDPREGAHWQARKSRGVVQFSESEPLSPWYSRKSYMGGPPPTFEEIKSRLPVPILDAAKPLVDLYWYC